MLQIGAWGKAIFWVFKYKTCWLFYNSVSYNIPTCLHVVLMLSVRNRNSWECDNTLSSDSVHTNFDLGISYQECVRVWVRAHIWLGTTSCPFQEYEDEYLLLTEFLVWTRKVGFVFPLSKQLVSRDTLTSSSPLCADAGGRGVSIMASMQVRTQMNANGYFWYTWS